MNHQQQSSSNASEALVSIGVDQLPNLPSSTTRAFSNLVTKLRSQNAAIKSPEELFRARKVQILLSMRDDTAGSGIQDPMSRHQERLQELESTHVANLAHEQFAYENKTLSVFRVIFKDAMAMGGRPLVQACFEELWGEVPRSVEASVPLERHVSTATQASREACRQKEHTVDTSRVQTRLAPKSVTARLSDNTLLHNNALLTNNDRLPNTLLAVNPRNQLPPASRRMTRSKTAALVSGASGELSLEAEPDRVERSYLSPPNAKTTSVSTSSTRKRSGTYASDTYDCSKRGRFADTPESESKQHFGRQVSPAREAAESVDFSEIFEDGKARIKYIIVKGSEPFNGWYILRCDRHNQYFRRAPVHGASRHLCEFHGLPSRHNRSIEMLGVRVRNCNRELADKNNAAAEKTWTPRKQASAKKGKKSLASLAKKPVPSNPSPPKQQPLPSLAPVPSNDNGIIDPVEGDLYSVFCPDGNRFLPALMLRMGNFDGLGVEGSIWLEHGRLGVPGCYITDTKKLTFSKWTPGCGYEDGGFNVRERMFPVMYFDGSEFPSNTSVGWAAAKNLRVLDYADPEMPFHRAVSDFLSKRASMRQQYEPMSPSHSADPGQSRFSDSQADEIATGGPPRLCWANTGHPSPTGSVSGFNFTGMHINLVDPNLVDPDLVPVNSGPQEGVSGLRPMIEPDLTGSYLTRHELSWDAPLRPPKLAATYWGETGDASRRADGSVSSTLPSFQALDESLGFPTRPTFHGWGVPRFSSPKPTPHAKDIPKPSASKRVKRSQSGRPKRRPTIGTTRALEEANNPTASTEGPEG